jgi:hypothetical protein
MDSIEVSINRLHDNVSRFIGPSTALQDIELLKAQIELRRLALRDIEIIHYRLRPFIKNSPPRGRARLDAGRVPVHF